MPSQFQADPITPAEARLQSVRREPRNQVPQIVGGEIAVTWNSPSISLRFIKAFLILPLLSYKQSFPLFVFTISNTNWENRPKAQASLHETYPDEAAVSSVWAIRFPADHPRATKALKCEHSGLRKFGN